MEQNLHQTIAITLPLGAWNTVIMLLMKGPWETANPLIQAISSQAERAQQTQDQQSPRLVNKD